jgi:hypothetical protein
VIAKVQYIYHKHEVLSYVSRRHSILRLSYKQTSSIVCQDMMLWKPGKLQGYKLEDLCLMLNCTSPCTNILSQCVDRGCDFDTKIIRIGLVEPLFIWLFKI